MFQSWRLKIREAESAFRLNRLDEAGKLLRDQQLQQFEPGRRVASQVAGGLVERAKLHLAGGDTMAGWRDLEAAAQLGGATNEWVSVRQQLIGEALKEACQLIEADDPAAALNLLDGLTRKEVSGQQLRSLSVAARRMLSARQLCRAGKFDEAAEQLQTISALNPELKTPGKLVGKCQEQQRRANRIAQSLQVALTSGDWEAAVSKAEELLEVAPDHRLARQAREQARRRLASPGNGQSREQVGVMDRHTLQTVVASPAPMRGEGRLPDQMLLWVDAVGGYLLCLKEEIVIGQAVPESPVDVAILGDLSRRHAMIRRIGGEAFAIEPIADVRVGGKLVTETTLLSHDDEIQLGRSVKLRFGQPHPLSSTARLDLLGRHRVQPWVDGILLMTDSCLLGPNRRCHILCREWSKEVVLHRHGDELICRSPLPFEIDDQTCGGRGPVGPGSRVCGEDFSFSFEAM